ncbi:MAG: hypothetical protein IKI76_02910 [Selenomonadaceae bacterium]|nr:hypothetical protein [Selenomonadaceae bacterium]
MTYEIILSHTADGVSAEYDCDDEELYQLLHDDEEFQDELARLVMHFEEVAAAHDEASY